MSWQIGLDIAAIATMSVGAFFLAVGTLGLLRLPDFFSRIHAIGKCDTLGAMLVLGGLALHYLGQQHAPADVLNALKIVAIVIFVFLANPTATHAFSRSALRSGLKPWVPDESEQTDTVTASRIWRKT